MKKLEDFLKELGEHDPDKPDCEACSLEHKEDLKHQPRHTCGKDGPNENHINLFKKVKGE